MGRIKQYIVKRLIMSKLRRQKIEAASKLKGKMAGKSGRNLNPEAVEDRTIVNIDESSNVEMLQIPKSSRGLNKNQNNSMLQPPPASISLP
jgi:stalled ribosome alternative rescue factor ArfA